MALNPGTQRAQQASGIGSINQVLSARRLIPFLLITIFMTGLAVLIHGRRSVLTEYLDNFALDQYFSVRGEPKPEVVADDLLHTKNIVLIETSHQIPRSVLAQLLDKIRLAKVIVIDMMFVDNEAELEPDEKQLYRDEIKTWRHDTDILARKIRQLGNVAVGMWPEQVRKPSAQPNQRARQLEWIWQRPNPQLWRSGRYRAHVLVELDQWDQTVRKVALFNNKEWPAQPPERVPSLGLAAAAAAEGISPQQLQKLQVKDGVLRLGRRSIPVDEDGTMLIDYVGDRASFESEANHRNYMQVLTSTFDEPGDYKDKIIFIGESSFKSKEIMNTPFGEMPGMQIHANVAATLLSKQGPPRLLPLWQTAVIAWLCSLCLIVPLIRLPLWGSLIFAGLQIVLLVCLGAWIFTAFHSILPVSVPAVAIALTYNAIALYEYRRARHTLGRFIGQEMVARTMDLFSPPKLGGQLGEASAFFCDLRGFTRLAATMSPEAVTDLVNSYTNTLVKVVRKYGGRPIDYQGDGVFILFEASVSPEYSVNAVRAAIDMKHAFLQLRQQWVEQGAPLMEMGIGIDTGTLMIGAVGADEHLKMGAVGDAVNTASRIQRLNEECGYTILITRNTCELVRHAVTVTYCGAYSVRGREQPVEVYGVENILVDEDDIQNSLATGATTDVRRTAQTGLQSESKVASV